MKANCFIILYTLFFLSLTSCSDECEREVENLKDLNKYVPYTGTETLRFLHNSTDTQTFVGQGMERFFVSTSDEGCFTDHESIRIRFKNTQSSDEIKMEYVFDDIAFRGYPYEENPFRFYKFYYNNTFSGTYIYVPYAIEINGYTYNRVGAFGTSTYIMYRFPEGINYSGILKIKYPNDTLTLIR